MSSPQNVLSVPEHLVFPAYLPISNHPTTVGICHCVAASHEQHKNAKSTEVRWMDCIFTKGESKKYKNKDCSIQQLALWRQITQRSMDRTHFKAMSSSFIEIFICPFQCCSLYCKQIKLMHNRRIALHFKQARMEV